MNTRFEKLKKKALKNWPFRDTNQPENDKKFSSSLYFLDSADLNLTAAKTLYNGFTSQKNHTI